MINYKFIYSTIKEVQAKEIELKNIYGAENVGKCLDYDVYYYVSFNIFN